MSVVWLVLVASANASEDTAFRIDVDKKTSITESNIPLLPEYDQYLGSGTVVLRIVSGLPMKVRSYGATFFWFDSVDPIEVTIIATSGQDMGSFGTDTIVGYYAPFQVTLNLKSRSPSTVLYLHYDYSFYQGSAVNCTSYKVMTLKPTRRDVVDEEKDMKICENGGHYQMCKDWCDAVGGDKPFCANLEPNDEVDKKKYDEAMYCRQYPHDRMKCLDTMDIFIVDVLKQGTYESRRITDKMQCGIWLGELTNKVIRKSIPLACLRYPPIRELGGLISDTSSSARHYKMECIKDYYKYTTWNEDDYDKYAASYEGQCSESYHKLYTITGSLDKEIRISVDDRGAITSRNVQGVSATNFWISFLMAPLIIIVTLSVWRWDDIKETMSEVSQIIQLERLKFLEKKYEDSDGAKHQSD